jgi:hypothetical protein
MLLARFARSSCRTVARQGLESVALPLTPIPEISRSRHTTIDRILPAIFLAFGEAIPFRT